jgi:hypothetical protein
MNNQKWAKCLETVHAYSSTCGWCHQQEISTQKQHFSSSKPRDDNRKKQRLFIHHCSSLTFQLSHGESWTLASILIPFTLLPTLLHSLTKCNRYKCSQKESCCIWWNIVFLDAREFCWSGIASFAWPMQPASSSKQAMTSNCFWKWRILQYGQLITIMDKNESQFICIVVLKRRRETRDERWEATNSQHNSTWLHGYLE